MKRTILAVVTLLTVFALGMLTGVPRGHSVGEAPALAAPAPAALAVPMPNRCPAIHEAVHALEVAMHDMEQAGHNFCGRKREAMESTRRAIHDLREAENCDRCRE
ncbi:MAG: hypothetical protein WCD04_08815 [Terriglobia bacterium]|jgi:hypothetical protein